MSQQLKITDWGCCAEDSYNEDIVLCSICNKAYHIACLITNSAEKTSFDERESSWVCSLCTSDLGGTNNDITPLRSQQHNKSMRPFKRIALNSPPRIEETEHIERSLTRDDVGSVVKEILHAEMESLYTRLSQQIHLSITAELAPFRKELSELKATVTSVNQQCEDVTTRQRSIEQEFENLQSENASLRLINKDLVNKINHLEQFARSNNVEIQCVPEKKSENVISIVENICQAVNCDIKNEHILSCSRIAKLNPKSTRPRSIVVQFNSPRTRDNFLAASIKFNKSNPKNKLNTSHIGLNGVKSPIFIVEHLSTSNKALHAAARVAAKEKGYMFVWVRNGRIYMRKDETSAHKLIKSIDSLNNLE